MRTEISLKVKVAVMTLILLLFSSLSVNAANYYVSTAGNDSNSGAETSPFRTVQRGADIARAGDIVYIMAGTYNESGRPNPSFNNPPRGIVLQYSGVSGSPITFKPYPGHEGQVVIDQCATGPTTSCAQNTTARAYAGFILPPGRGYITIEGLEIKNASTAAVWVAASPTEAYSYGVVIRNNHIHDIWGNDNTGGIRPDLTDGILIEGNRIHDIVTGGTGIHNASGVHTYLARNGTIRNNELYNARNGVFEKWPDPQKGLNVTANIIHDVSSGIRIGGATGSDVAHDVQISQNVIFNASSCVRTVPELVAPTTLIQIWNNTFVDCGWGLSLIYYPDARIWNNIIVSSVNSGSNYYTDLVMVGNPQHLTYSDNNLFYFYPSIPQNYAPFMIGESSPSYLTLTQWRALGLDANSIYADPLFVNKSSHDFNLQTNSPARGAGYSGSDIGADTTLPPTPTPDGGGGGDTGGNTGSNGGGDASASGGSGCGFVKDINGKGPGAKGEGVAFAMMLIITLAGTVLIKRVVVGKVFLKYILKGIFYLFFVVTFLSSFSSVYAADYYVDGNNPNASDTNSGTAMSPWKTMYKAMSAPLLQGDTVHVMAGTYDASVGGTWSQPALRPSSSGVQGNPITFRAEPRHSVILDTKNTPSTPAIGVRLQNYIVIDGFVIPSAEAKGIAVFGISGAKVIGVVLQNNIVHGVWQAGVPGDNTDGIRLEYTSGTIVRNNIIYNVDNPAHSENAAGIKMYHNDTALIENNEIYNTVSGIFDKEQGDNNTFRRNYLHNVKLGIYLQSGGSGNSIVGDQMSENVINQVVQGIGILPADGTLTDNITITNNVIANYTDTGVFPASTGTFNIYNNIFHRTGSSLRGDLFTYNDPPNSIVLMDYNLFVTEPKFYIGVYLTNRVISTLHAWQNATVHDPHSNVGDAAFVGAATGDFHLKANSPAIGAGRVGGVSTGDHVNQGAYITGSEIIGPTGGIDGGGSGGGNTPPPSSSSGGDSGGGSGGGSGCGFVKNDGKGQKAKGEGLPFAMMLIIALTGIALARKRTGNINATKEGVLVMNIRKNSLIKIAAISILLTIFWSTSAHAQPQISSFSGSLTDGSTITINGNSFGTNGPNIVLFDNFESGTNGSYIKTGAGSATIGQWDGIGGGDKPAASLPIYDNRFKVSGGLASRGNNTVATITNTIDAGSPSYTTFALTSDIFVSYWFYMPSTSDWPCYNNIQCNDKFVWVVNTSTKEDDRVLPATSGGSRSSLPNLYMFGNNSYGETALSPSLLLSKGKWYRFWSYLHGAADTTAHEELWVASPSGEANLVSSKRVNRTGQIFYTTFTGFSKIYVNSYYDWCNGCTESAPTFDDVYIAIGSGARARVEIGDAATYATSKNLTIATVTSWSDTSITATIRQGSFGKFKQCLFICN